MISSATYRQGRVYLLFACLGLSLVGSIARADDDGRDRDDQVPSSPDTRLIPRGYVAANLGLLGIGATLGARLASDFAVIVRGTISYAGNYTELDALAVSARWYMYRGLFLEAGPATGSLTYFDQNAEGAQYAMGTYGASWAVGWTWRNGSVLTEVAVLGYQQIRHDMPKQPSFCSQCDAESIQKGRSTVASYHGSGVLLFGVGPVF